MIDVLACVMRKGHGSHEFKRFGSGDQLLDWLRRELEQGNVVAILSIEGA